MHQALWFMTTLWAIAGAVWNGTEASSGSHPFVVGLRGSPTSESRCGGSLIAPAVVLTSVTCAWASWVSVGSHYSSGASDGERIPIASMTIHPRFDSTTQVYNFALAHLMYPSTMPTVRLYWHDNVTSVSTANTTWIRGYASGPHELSNVLLETHARILSNAECTNYYGRSVQDSWLCVEADVHPDDIGGPVTILDKFGMEYLVGVSSWGNERRGPGVYARVGAARDFIEPFLVPQSSRNGTNRTHNALGSDGNDDGDMIVAPK
ncbi:hypothetical protein H310_09602 [Aphanomyces invadans]|uniref:Peptidase S1 domain-containing protein n=1 Tax=Aphanomyces invadans TaxID=157072 RepID=A0A024TSU1_9STRA|nr:hypothetical protein H310_09602 [Aphanomyces invadans]ETV97220.1 hypothetical protein H310_09602 [Aphanomyces invadans]|eukprot:XP_008873928.1 hypothetical protein H310_09602 [Aphanomyces invadans]